jgi:hypothetical protein
MRELAIGAVLAALRRIVELADSQTDGLAFDNNLFRNFFTAHNSLCFFLMQELTFGSMSATLRLIVEPTNALVFTFAILSLM